MGEPKHDGLTFPGQVVLAHEPPFTIARARINPATRQIEADGRTRTVEPRVMQVLVALFRANNTIVTRDELIERCWDGRIVSDDAINRVLSRLRHLGADIGPGTFIIETIARVGYRMCAHRPVQALFGSSAEIASSAPDLQLSRRAVISAGVAALAAATAGLIWRFPMRDRPVPEAVELYNRGNLAQRAGLPSQTRQSTSFFEQAVRLDPAYADAWGALALSYTHSLDGFSEAQLASMPGRITSAARRALELDPNNADAQLAVACIKPFFRNWTESEARLRELTQKFPNHWLCNGRLAILLYQVGRLEEGARLHERVIAIDPMIPGPYAFAATALSRSGRIQEADSLLQKAQERWPAHPMLWFAKYEHLLYSGRPQSAIAFALDPESLPSGFGPAEVNPALALARAADSMVSGDVEAALEMPLQFARSDARSIPEAVSIFALFGRLDLTFAGLDRYLINQGSFGTPAQITPLTRRYTDSLFTLPMAAARSDPRFAALVSRIGLEDYWRKTQSAPDYGRA